MMIPGAPQILSFLKNPIVVAAIAVMAAYLYGYKVANDKCRAMVAQSRLDAAAMDKRIAAEADRRAAVQRAQAEARATQAERDLNEYLKRNANNPLCVAGDDDLRHFDKPSWLRIDPISKPGPRPPGGR